MTKLNHHFSFDIYPIPPYNFELTVHKPAGWPLFSRDEVWKDKVLWTALHMGNELIGVKLRSSVTNYEPQINAVVFLKDFQEKSIQTKIQNTIISKLGADTDLSDFYLVAEKDPILKDTVKDLFGLHNTEFPTLFASATLAISLQMAPIARSNQMQENLVERYGEVAEFDGKKIRAWPTAKVISKTNVE